jgi:RNA polymerase sigma factor (sigma-70 family)
MRRQISTDMTTLGGRLDAPDKLAELNEMLERFETLLSHAPPVVQEVYHLRYEKGKTQKEIGDALGVSRRTAQKRLQETNEFFEKLLQ